MTRAKHLARWIAILGALTLVFVFDDLLYILLFEALLEIRPNIVIRVTVVVALFALNALLAVAVYRAMRRKPTTGAEGLLGERGKAVTDLRPGDEGWVEVHGERWLAESLTAVQQGQPVQVVQVGPGLKLIVRPAPAHPFFAGIAITATTQSRMATGRRWKQGLLDPLETGNDAARTKITVRINFPRTHKGENVRETT